MTKDEQEWCDYYARAIARTVRHRLDDLAHVNRCSDSWIATIGAGILKAMTLDHSETLREGIDRGWIRVAP